jgi:hypothetical protein
MHVLKVAIHLDLAGFPTRQSRIPVLNRDKSHPAPPRTSRSTNSGMAGFFIRTESVGIRVRSVPCWSITWVSFSCGETTSEPSFSFRCSIVLSFDSSKRASIYDARPAGSHTRRTLNRVASGSTVVLSRCLIRPAWLFSFWLMFIDLVLDTGDHWTPQAYDISNIQGFTQSVSIGANGCKSTTCKNVHCPCLQAYPPGVSTHPQASVPSLVLCREC